MRALITGVGGFAGSFLAEYCLARADVEVIGLVRALERLGHAAPFASHIQVVAADLRDGRAVERAIADARPDIVFHLAGQAFVPSSFDDPAGTLLDNAVGQAHVILALLRHRPEARLLVVGSAAEYGLVRPDENPVDEQVALRPTDPYGVSKVAQDLLAFQYFVSHNLQAVRVRPFNHTGPRQSDQFAPSWFARQVAEIEAGGAEPDLPVGNLSAIRDFTDVRDVVRAYFLAGTQGKPGEVYNIGSGQGRRMADILGILADLSRAPFSIREDAARFRPLDVPSLVCDGARFRALTGWEPAFSLEQTLTD
ncbi:MAG: GDP-mannose 4,6-dehydratase, partial [Chloroflexota bacterium]